MNFGALVLQFHAEDFACGSRRDRSCGRLSWHDLLPRARGGVRLKLFLRDTSPERIVRTHRGIVSRFSSFRDATVSAIALEWLSQTEASKPLLR